jgi:hypothetical protein
MLLGACRLKKRILICVVGLCAGLIMISCSGSKGIKGPPSGLTNRVLASQGVSSSFTAGGLVFINGHNDTLARVSELSAGSSPGLMVLSPTRNILAAFDAGSNAVDAVDTVKETSLGRVALPGPTSSMVLPIASPLGYAAVPTATVNGFSVLGAIEVMNLSAGSITTTIGVTNAQTVIANSTGSQLLVFSNDSDSVTVLFPNSAVPPVDTSCLINPTNTAVCVQVPGFDRPVYGIISGSTAYILNCGLQCHGTQPASVAVFDLGTLTITNTIPVHGAYTALLSGSTLYVAGMSPTENDCTGQTTAATTCGRLDIVDLGSGTVTGTAVITDGHHSRMDLTANGHLYIGSHDCTNIGNVNIPSGEVRGCLSVFHTSDGTVIFPPDNGDVNGFQGFIGRNVEYVAEGGALRVYDTTKDVLLINNLLPQGTINVVGYVGDVKAIDFF